MSPHGFCEQIQYLLSVESICTAIEGNNNAASMTDQLIKGVICNLTDSGGVISERAFPGSLCERISRIVKNDGFDVLFAPSIGDSGREQLGTLMIRRKTPNHSPSSSEQTSSN